MLFISAVCMFYTTTTTIVLLTTLFQKKLLSFVLTCQHAIIDSRL